MSVNNTVKKSEGCSLRWRNVIQDRIWDSGGKDEEKIGKLVGQSKDTIITFFMGLKKKREIKYRTIVCKLERDVFDDDLASYFT